MIAKFNTSTGSSTPAVTGASNGKGGGMMKTVLIVALIGAALYGVYRYVNRPKPVTTVSVNDEEEY